MDVAQIHVITSTGCQATLQVLKYRAFWRDIASHINHSASCVTTVRLLWKFLRSQFTKCHTPFEMNQWLFERQGWALKFPQVVSITFKSSCDVAYVGSFRQFTQRHLNHIEKRHSHLTSKRKPRLGSTWTRAWVENLPIHVQRRRGANGALGPNLNANPSHELHCTAIECRYTLCTNPSPVRKLSICIVTDSDNV